MKIFNRGNDAKAAPAGPAAASAAPVAPPPPVAAPAAPPAPDLTAILDANVKEMSEKIARLTTSIEGSQQERAGFEAKIEQMEDRMRKLSALTEMISAQYNPFVGDAPPEREAMPAPEVGLAQSVALPPLPAAAEAPAPPAALAPSLGVPVALALPAEAAPVEIVPSLPALEAAPQEDAPGEEIQGVHLWAVSPSFESSMLLLSWADMLLKAGGSREAVQGLADYYHNIGWIGDPARDQLLAYADGLVAPAAAPASEWRATSDVHERSLLFVEKLKAAARRTA